MNIFYALLIGGICGWIAEKVMKGNYGLFTNIILGLIGGFIGGWVIDLLGFSKSGGLVPSIITGTLGAVILIWLYRKIRS